MQHGARRVRYVLCPVSVRVPWHGGGWEGTVYEDPAASHACMLLDTAGKERDDQFEAAHNGQG